MPEMWKTAKTAKDAVQEKKGVSREKVCIYAMTHKEASFPKDSLYRPLQVGYACRGPMRPDGSYEKKKDFGYLCDATGDNISLQNPYYSELTGVYWIWKNVKDQDIVGVCHYRRYFQNAAGRLFSAEQICQILSRYDMMTTKKVILDHSYLEGFSGKHNRRDLLVTRDVIAKRFPEYLHCFETLVNQNATYFGNMMICRKEEFDAYAKWLFTILFDVQKQIDMRDYNDYQKRVFGFISELLLMVYVKNNRLKVYECDVAVIGEKTETSETKKRIADFLQKGQIGDAMKYFMAVYEKRPDILMEASDINSDLKICMQILSSLQEGEIVPDLNKAISSYRELNSLIRKLPEYLGKGISPKEKIFLSQFSKTAIRNSLKIQFPYDIKIQEQYLGYLMPQMTEGDSTIHFGVNHEK
ncbi:MAG: DUF4422 domain-containing protein [Lachnospiraceae bacterium]